MLRLRHASARIFFWVRGGERRGMGNVSDSALTAHATAALAYLLNTGYKGASDLYIDANIQLALAAARQVLQCWGFSAAAPLRSNAVRARRPRTAAGARRQRVADPRSPHSNLAVQLAERTGKRVHMLLPDEIEFKRAEDM